MFFFLFPLQLSEIRRLLMFTQGVDKEQWP